MTADPAGDVFGADTYDAPIPLSERDRGVGMPYLWPHPDDPRWTVDAQEYPDGTVVVFSVTPRTS